MNKSGKISQEIKEQAEYYVNNGYQSLLAYEVPGGGFQWCGHAPAVNVWTAYGLILFNDMAQVHDVDPAIIERTQNWLYQMQGQDGSWENNLTTTAFIMYCLTDSGATGPVIDKGISYIKQNLNSDIDPYTYALCTNALVSWNKSDSDTVKALESLYNMRTETEDIAYWDMSSSVVLLDGVSVSKLEPTALSAYAFLKAGKYSTTVNKSITFLIREKSPSGVWSSTQSTTLALKTLILSLGGNTEEVNGQAEIYVNDQKVESFSITPEDYDVFRQYDLGEYTKTGKKQC